jgi:tetratricopeptide (TPR) repeat protein
MIFSLRELCSGIALALLLSTAGIAAEIPSEWDRPRQEIADAWRVRKEVISVGNDPVGAKQLEQIRKLQRRYGLTALPLLSLSLVRETRDPGESPQEERLRYAELFAPNFPAIAYSQCAGIRNFHTFVQGIVSCFQGAQWELLRPDGQLRLLANAFFAGFHAFVLVSLLFLSFFLLRYGVAISRALSHTMKYVTPSGIVFLVFLVSLLAWLYLGWMGPALVLFFVLWRHVNWKERSVLIFLWLLALLLPLAMYAPAFLIRYERGIVATLEKPLEDISLAEKATQLQRWISRHPEDADALFTLGIIEKETGRLENAKEWYRKASALRPGWHKPIVNLATIAFIQKNPEEAVSLLQKAISISPQSVAAHFDLGKIYLNETRLDEARVSLKKSKDIDAALFAELDRISDPSNSQDFLIDESLSEEEILPRIWGFSPDLRDDRNALYQSYFPNLSLAMYWTLLGAIILLSLALNQKWPARSLREEAAPADPRPQSSSVDIFDPNLSRAFKREYSPLHALWEKFQERWCTLLIPGLHHLFRENFVRALFWLFSSTGILILLLERDRWIVGPYHLPGFPAFPLAAVLLSVFGVIYIYEAIRAIRS